MINRMIIAERPFDIIQGRFVSVAHFISHKKVAEELAAALNASFEGVRYEAVEENHTGNWVVALRRGETIKKVHTAFCTGWAFGRGYRKMDNGVGCWHKQPRAWLKVEYSVAEMRAKGYNPNRPPKANKAHA